MKRIVALLLLTGADCAANPAPPPVGLTHAEPDPTVVAAQIRAAEAQEAASRAAEAKTRREMASAEFDRAQAAKAEEERAAAERQALAERCAKERADVEAWRAKDEALKAKRGKRREATAVADDGDVTVSANQAPDQIARPLSILPPRLSVPCGGEPAPSLARARTLNYAH